MGALRKIAGSVAFAVVFAAATVRAQTFAPQRDDVLVSGPPGTYVSVRGRAGYARDADGPARFESARATGLVALPLPLFGVLVGNFVGDGLDDLLLTQAPGGPYLLVNRAGFFALDYRNRRDRDRPPNLGRTWLRGLEGRPDVDLPLPFVDALVGDFAGSALDDLILPHAKRGPLLLENRGDRFEIAPLRFDRAEIPYELGYAPFHEAPSPRTFPLVHAVAGDFAGDGRTDLLLLAAQDGPRLAVRTDAGFAIEGAGDRGADQMAARLAAAAAAGLRPRDLIGRTFAGNFGGDGRTDLLVLAEGAAPMLLVHRGERFEPSPEDLPPEDVIDALRRRCAVVGEFLVVLD